MSPLDDAIAIEAGIVKYLDEKYGDYYYRQHAQFRAREVAEQRLIALKAIRAPNKCEHGHSVRCDDCYADGLISDSRSKREPPRRETGSARKGESGGAQRAIAQTTPEDNLK